MTKRISPNFREIISTQSSITGNQEYPTSTNRRIDVNLASSTPPTGATNFTTGQQALSSSATVIVAARATRTSVTIVNLSTTDVYIGGATVTTATGQLLLGTKGSAITIEAIGVVYGIVATGTPSVSYEEEFN